MRIAATPATFHQIHLWRDMYRLEMACQIVHDSIHIRHGWTQEYVLTIYVVPSQRLHVFELFKALLDTSKPASIEVQSNDALAAAMLHAFGPQVASDALLFHDRITTSLVLPGATLRVPSAVEAPDADVEERQWRRVVEIDGHAAASGGVLFHYNRPYGDIYMDVEESFRWRGLGSFLVQELKRLCYEGGHVPAARCNPTNIASQRTLQRAGFVPCGHLLKGLVRT